MVRLLPLLLVASACTSNAYTEGALNLTWKPPQGVALQAESTEGKVTTARFSGGVEVHSVAEAPPPVGTDLDGLKATLLANAKMEMPGEVKMGRSGTVPAGPSVRWEMAAGSDRSLLYFVGGTDRYVLISLNAPATSFSRKSDKLELSMASLKFH